MPPTRRVMFVAGVTAVVAASVCFQLAIHGNLQRHHERAIFGVIGVPLAFSGTLVLYWTTQALGVLLATLIIFGAQAIGALAA